MILLRDILHKCSSHLSIELKCDRDVITFNGEVPKIWESKFNYEVNDYDLSKLPEKYLDYKVEFIYPDGMNGLVIIIDDTENE